MVGLKNYFCNFELWHYSIHSKLLTTVDCWGQYWCGVKCLRLTVQGGSEGVYQNGGADSTMGTWHQNINVNIASTEAPRRGAMRHTSLIYGPKSFVPRDV